MTSRTDGHPKKSRIILLVSVELGLGGPASFGSRPAVVGPLYFYFGPARTLRLASTLLGCSPKRLKIAVATKVKAARPPRRSAQRLRKAALLEQLGPGLITGAADDDPSGIATYSQAGAQFGFDMLWTMVLTYPLMTAVQLVSAQIGRVTGYGLAKNLGAVLPKPVVVALVGLLFVANTVNIGADLAAMGAATRLAVGGPSHLYTVGFALLSLTLQLFIPYSRYANYLKWLTLVLLAYIARRSITSETVDTRKAQDALRATLTGLSKRSPPISRRSTARPRPADNLIKLPSRT